MANDKTKIKVLIIIFSDGRKVKMNRRPTGYIGLDGWAEHWFTTRRAALSRLHNRGRERIAYNRAMDRLFLNSEEVKFRKQKITTKITEIL